MGSVRLLDYLMSILKKNFDWIIVLRINVLYVHEYFEEKSLMGSVRIIIFMEVNTLLDEVESKGPSIWNEYVRLEDR